MLEEFSSLPSRYRSRASGEQDSEAALWEAKEVDDAPVVAVPATQRRISPTTLAITTQCELRAIWRARGEKDIGPSPFTQSVMDDGKEYETRLLEEAHCKIWIQAIQQELGIEFPEGVKRLPYQAVAQAKGESLKSFAQRCSKALEIVLPKEKSPAFFLHEPRLATVENGVLLQGKPDLLIWTGKQWLIADIKCSEEARRTHGMQIATYARIFGAMRPNKKQHPMGVVIHCAPGYRYTATSNGKDKETALAHTQATSFPLDSLSGALDQAISLLLNADDAALQSAIDKAVFSSVCLECQFRLRCYPRFLQQRHVSLVPFMKAEIAAVLDAGIRTIDELIAAIDDPASPAYPTLLDLKDGSQLQLGCLHQKAERIREKALYCKWRASPAELARPLFFAAVENDSAFSPDLDHFTKHEPPTCLIVYSERERRIAWAKIYEAGKKGSGLATFVLSEIVQENVHGPVPSITLRPLADLLASHPDYNGFLTRYPESAADIRAAEKTIQDSPIAAERMQHVQLVWNFLTSAAIPFSLPKAP